MRWLQLQDLGAEDAVEAGRRLGAELEAMADDRFEVALHEPSGRDLDTTLPVKAAEPLATLGPSPTF